MAQECYRCGGDDHYARDCTAELGAAPARPAAYRPAGRQLPAEQVRELADACRHAADIDPGSGLVRTPFRERTGMLGRSDEGLRRLAARQAAEARASRAEA